MVETRLRVPFEHDVPKDSVRVADLAEPSAGEGDLPKSEEGSGEFRSEVGALVEA